MAVIATGTVKLPAVQATKADGQAVVVRSGNAANHTAIGIGRTADEFLIGIERTSGGVFTTDSVSGDAVLRLEDTTKRIRIAIGSGGAELNIAQGIVTVTDNFALVKASSGAAVGVLIHNNVASASGNKARLSLAPHNGYSQSNAPYVEGYDTGSDTGIAIGTFSGTLQERLRVTAAGIVAIGTTVVASAAAGEVVVAHNKPLRSVNSAGTDTQKLIGLGASNVLIIGTSRVAAGTPGSFAANYYLQFQDKDGNGFFVPAMAAAW